MGNVESTDPVAELPPEVARALIAALPTRDASRDQLARSLRLSVRAIADKAEADTQHFRTEMWQNSQAELQAERERLRKQMKAASDAAFAEREHLVVQQERAVANARVRLAADEAALTAREQKIIAANAKTKAELDAYANAIEVSRENLRTEKEKMKCHTMPEKLVLNVGGVTHETTRTTLLAQGDDTFFGRLLSGRHALRFEPDGTQTRGPHSLTPSQDAYSSTGLVIRSHTFYSTFATTKCAYLATFQLQT